MLDEALGLRENDEHPVPGPFEVLGASGQNRTVMVVTAATLPLRCLFSGVTNGITSALMDRSMARIHAALIGSASTYKTNGWPRCTRRKYAGPPRPAAPGRALWVHPVAPLCLQVVIVP